jgi:broad specificity phosphatase PhoE
MEVGNSMLRKGFCFMQTVESTQSTQTSSIEIAAIYSSPLKRAHETAKIFANILSGENKESQNKIKVLDSLIERDFGIMTGMPTSSILDKCGHDRVLSTEKIQYFLDPEGAETFPDLIVRAKKLLSYIEGQIESIADTRSTSILLVTHGDFGKMIYAAYYDLDWKEVLKQFHFGNSEVLLLTKHSQPENAHVFETSRSTLNVKDVLLKP